MEKTSLKSNFVFNIGYQILVIILPLITAPYVSRVLGAHNLGVYAYTQAFANYFYLFAMLGVNNYGNRSIARVRDDIKKRSETFFEIYVFQLGVSVVVSIVYIAYFFFFIKENRIIYLLQFFYIISGAIDINWFCFGMEQFKLTTIRSTIVRVTMAAATFAFVRSENDLWIYTLILSFQYLASAIVVWPFVLKHIQRVKLSWKGIKQHIKPNLVLFWPVIAVSLYNIMDKLMLGFFSEETEVAYYTYAERIIQIPLTLILALDNVMMPRMSNLYAKKDQKKASSLMNSVMLFAMFMSAAMGFGLAGVGQVFAPWFYGDTFVRCGYFIFLLSPIIIFKGWAGALRTQFIIPTGRDKVYVTSLTAGAITNLCINFILIPKMSGVGAIIGTIVAEFTVVFIQFYLCRKDIPIREYIINGLGFCVIGFVMFGIVYMLSDISSSLFITLIVQLVVGVIIYGLLGCFYMIKVCKNPVLVNEILKVLHIKKRF